VRLLASISCEYIIKYKESFFDEKSSTLCMIIEYAENGDLEVILYNNLQKLILKNKNENKNELR
jgi:NIMA (never in mitosis gene a)-related kinase